MKKIFYKTFYILAVPISLASLILMLLGMSVAKEGIIIMNERATLFFIWALFFIGIWSLAHVLFFVFFIMTSNSNNIFKSIDELEELKTLYYNATKAYEEKKNIYIKILEKLNKE